MLQAAKQNKYNYNKHSSVEKKKKQEYIKIANRSCKKFLDKRDSSLCVRKKIKMLLCSYLGQRFESNDFRERFYCHLPNGWLMYVNGIARVPHKGAKYSVIGSIVIS